MDKLKGMTTCTVCGRDFPLLAEEHYIAREPGRSGFAAIAGGPEFGLWDVIDCPHCGCQIKLQPRMRMTDCLGRDVPWYGEEDTEEDDD